VLKLWNLEALYVAVTSLNLTLQNTNSTQCYCTNLMASSQHRYMTEAGGFSFVQRVQTGSWTYPASCSMGIWALQPNIRWLGGVADHMPPSNTQVRKILMCMSTPLCAVMACKETGGWLGLDYHIQKKKKKKKKKETKTIRILLHKKPSQCFSANSSLHFKGVKV